MGFNDNFDNDSLQTSVHKFVDNTRIVRCPRVAAMDEEQNVTRKTHFVCPQTVARKELRSWVGLQPAASAVIPQNFIRRGVETDVHSARSGVDLSTPTNFGPLSMKLTLSFF